MSPRKCQRLLDICKMQIILSCKNLYAHHPVRHPATDRRRHGGMIDRLWKMPRLHS